jgi:4-hydroxybenzoate polyprenyltransferase
MLLLGRVSNLPTVWSNCLAGWLLGGGGRAVDFLVLALGASFLYVGGMFLNDAFDEEFDRANRRERPIPSGQIEVCEVWRWGWSWLGVGLVSLVWLGWWPTLLGVLLVGAILLYDAVHKWVAFAPILMALCRVLLYWVAAASATEGITGLALWSSLALGSYVTGLSLYAAHERGKRALPRWPLALMAVPLVLAWVVNSGPYGPRALLCALVLTVWIARSLHSAMRASSPNVPAAVGGLLAGIVLVDLLAVVGGDSLWVGVGFFALFGTTLIAQRFVPAT